ncbi:MAG: DUF3459 domain-containing protein, partial [Verrucomicrobia bacterium]|nr:DUF3459 domain-containing protein [Verrucomicrobiota bacterium]
MRKQRLGRLWSVALAVCGLGLAAASAEEPLGVTSRPGETTFRVWAPNARAVEVVGDFNGWKASAAERLSLDKATGIWSATLQRSRPPGAYRYVINGNLPRRDPYARAVAADGRSSLFYDPAAFSWEDDRPAGRPLDDLVIYEMHIGAYHDPKPQDGLPATFYDAIKRLDHLVDLGVSAVCVMPVHEFNGSHSWGYNPCDIFAVEQAYGGPDGLKAFVKACHRLGIAVHLDVVHNHYGPDNLDLLRFDGTGGEREGGIYFYDRPGLAHTPWGPRPEYDEPMVRRFVKDNIMMWLEEYRVDGFRWDSAINIRASRNGADPIPAGAQMLDDINSQVRSRFPHAVNIAEDSMDIGNFHGSWDFDFHHQVVPVLTAAGDAERSLGAVAYALETRPVTMARVIYVDNHDEAGKINGKTRLASEADPSNPAGDYARRMCGLGALLTLTAPGIPLILMGNEFQESGPFHDDRPLDWGKKQRHAGLFNLHRDLIRLRRNLGGRSEALKGMNIRVPLVNRSRNMLVYWRWHERAPGRPLVVVINLSGQALEEEAVPFPAPGPWDTLVDTEWARYGGGVRQEIVRPVLAERATGKVALSLPPYSARIYALVPGAPSPAAPPAEVEEEPGATRKQAVSLYTGLNLVVVGQEKTWPMKLTKDFQWEGRAEFQNLENAELKIAVAEGSLFWGAADDWAVPVPHRGILKRRGGHIRVEGVLDGAYRVRFNEDTLVFSIEPAG